MVAIHPAVAPLAGRIIDVDSHEQTPAQVWVEMFGDIMKPFADAKMAQTPNRNRNHPNVQGYPGDVTEISPDTIWKTKGPRAPGATDIRRRLDVMNEMKIDRQLMFPTAAGLYGMLLYAAEDNSPFHTMFGNETHEIGRQMIEAGNRWMVDVSKISSRVRPVPTVLGRTPDEIYDSVSRLIKDGIRAIMVNPGTLLGGISPAHNDHDRLYAMLAEANVPLTFHIGGELAFFQTVDWGNAKAFEGYKVTEETSMDPWRLSAMAIPVQNYIATLVTGAVFDRHPTLRVGALEFGAHWIGPLAEMLDFWHENNSSLEPTLYYDGQVSRRLPLKPSEYITRNVRVSPFDIEPVGKYIAKYGLEDVYCFATDYPHVEGGEDPIGRFAQSIVDAGLSERVIEKFFVQNGELLLPA